MNRVIDTEEVEYSRTSHQGHVGKLSADGQRSDARACLLDAAPAADIPISAASVPLFRNHILSGAKPRNEWQVGLEYEVFGYRAHDLQRIDAAEVSGLLGSLDAFDDLWVEEAPSSGSTCDGHAGHNVNIDRITVEPGGQIEFSGAPRLSLAMIERTLKRYLSCLQEIAVEEGIIFLGIGFDPLRTIEEQQWLPKPRYEVMRPYLATRGSRAWDMMCRTCAMQVSVDYDSEHDLATKYILSNRLAPILTAIFAHSPFENGRPSGYKSTRSAAWLQTDSDRTGVSPLALAFADRFSAADFVEYTLGVPMLFARREGRYLGGVSGLKFARFLNGEATAVAPQFHDWTDHLTTIFTEARLKQYIEIRSADAGSPGMALALQALLKGLMYDSDSLNAAFSLAPVLSASAMFKLQQEVARYGLAAQSSGVSVLSIAREIIELATSGLARQASDEGRYLDPLREQVLEDEVCPADILLKNWNGSWHGSIEKLIEYVRVA